MHGGRNVQNVFIVVTFYDKHWFFLKVQKHSFKCQYNLKEGVSVTIQCLEELWGLGELLKIFYFFRYYAACWRGGELPPVPDGGPAVEVA
jgi:hypothetical protein